MNGSQESYWLKLVRAHQHFDEVRDIVEPLSATRAYDVRETFDARRLEWEYTAHVENPDEPMLPVIVGDFLSNVRSALDHIAVAHAPRNRKRSASFPIVAEEIDRAKLNATEQKAREHFDSVTRGMSREVVDLIRSLQPYRAVSTENQDPRDHVLTLLSTFQNADKHRQLVVVSQGLIPERIEFVLPDGTRTSANAPPLPADRLLRDGARIERLPSRQTIEITGAVLVVMGSGPQGPQRPVLDFCSKLLDFVANRVLDPLNDLLVETPSRPASHDQGR